VCHIHVMTLRRPDVVLLDLDGTLTDAGPGIVNCIRFALDDMGIAHPDDATMRTFLGPPLADTFGRHFAMTDAQIDHAIEKYRERYHDVGLFENAVYDGIPELLQMLVGQGVTLAISTSKPTYSATRILEHFELDQYLTFIGGADLAGVRHDKASVIEHTMDELRSMDRLDADAMLVMVGDREHDVHGARAHGIDTIGVLWGYGTQDELIEAGAVQLAASPTVLGELLV